MIARSTDDRVIAGVMGGLAAHLGWSSTNLRVAYAIISVLSAGFPGTLVYILLWFVMPESRGAR